MLCFTTHHSPSFAPPNHSPITKNNKKNPWGLRNDEENEWCLWKYCWCFKKNHIVTSTSKRSSVYPLKIIDDKNEEPQTKTSSPYHFNPQVPPRSSGSESSGYFTPPDDHHLKEQDVEKQIFPLGSAQSNFQVIDSDVSDASQLEPPVVEQVFSTVDDEVVETSNEEEDQTDFAQEEIEEEEEDEKRSVIDEDGVAIIQLYNETKSKSRSEGSLQSALPEISERKNISSAPAHNQSSVISVVVPYSFSSEGLMQSKTFLPGSSQESDSFRKDPPVMEEECKTLKQRFLRRSVSSHLSSSLTSTKTSTSSATCRSSLIRPKELMLNQALQEMESPEWETIMQGLNYLQRLMARNQPEPLEAEMHHLCVLLAKSIRNLRSQVSRKACHVTSELFASSCRRGLLEVELETLAVPLLHRTADTNKFIRSDAHSALDTMCLQLSVSRVVGVISGKGFSHPNAVVRATATRLLSDLTMRLGAEKILQLPKDVRERFLVVAAKGLTEGSLETRKHAKRLMGTLAKSEHFQKVLLEAVPQNTLRHIAKIISTLNQ